MICPKCHAENKDQAKFCKSCGSKLEMPQQQTPEAPSSVQPRFCKKCGQQLKEGAKFCVGCGEPVSASPVTPDPWNIPDRDSFSNSNNAGSDKTLMDEMFHDERTIISNDLPVAESPINPGEIPNQVFDPIPASPAPVKKKFPFVILIPIFLLIIAVVLLVLIFRGVIPNPAELIANRVQTTSESEEDTDESGETDETAGSEEKADPDELFAEYDEMLATAKEKIENEDYQGGLVDLSAAISKYIKTAKEYDLTEDAESRISEAYEYYTEGTLKHVAILEGQSVLPALYEQMQTELSNALSLATELESAEYTVDTTKLTDYQTELPKRYKEAYIKLFNEFTTRDSWSRSEAWELMSGAKSLNLYDENDLNDPLRLRYEYALAFFTRKQAETGLADGSLTHADAINKLELILPETDYNPMLLWDCIQYCQASGQDASIYQNAYNEILGRISSTQGFYVESDADINHFWYFNDFGTYSVDPKNGVTQENREWIRNRYSGGLK